MTILYIFGISIYVHLHVCIDILHILLCVFLYIYISGYLFLYVYNYIVRALLFTTHSGLSDSMAAPTSFSRSLALSHSPCIFFGFPSHPNEPKAHDR